MKKEQLKVLGINVAQDIAMNDLLSENFNGHLYGLGSRQIKKIGVLRDVITEYNRNIPIDKKVQIKDSQMAAKILRPIFKGLVHEECWVLYLDRANHVINKEMVSSGTMYQTTVDNKIICKKAVLNSANSIILSHNHPSNDPHPGMNDIHTTDSLRKALQVFDMNLIDHIIISDGSYYSFTDEDVCMYDD